MQGCCSSTEDEFLVGLLQKKIIYCAETEGLVQYGAYREYRLLTLCTHREVCLIDGTKGGSVCSDPLTRNAFESASCRISAGALLVNH